MKRTMRLCSLLAAFSLVSAVATAAPPLDAKGKPEKTSIGKTEHYEVWRDQGGWHVRTHTAKFDHHFRGVVSVSGGELMEIKPYKLEHKGPEADLFVVGPEHREITFDFSTKGSVDGIDFRVKGEAPQLHFTLMLGEKDPAFVPDRILIGKAAVHPTENPFEIPAHEK